MYQIKVQNLFSAVYTLAEGHKGIGTFISRMLFQFYSYQDFILICLILILLMFIVSVNHMLTYKNFQKLLKIAIFGLFLIILTLLYLYHYDVHILYCEKHFNFIL